MFIEAQNEAQETIQLSSLSRPFIDSVIDIEELTWVIKANPSHCITGGQGLGKFFPCPRPLN